MEAATSYLHCICIYTYSLFTFLCDRWNVLLAGPTPTQTSLSGQALPQLPEEIPCQNHHIVLTSLSKPWTIVLTSYLFVHEAYLRC